MAASMLRAVAALCVESQALELRAAARPDRFKVFRLALSTGASSAPATAGAAATQIVLTSGRSGAAAVVGSAGGSSQEGGGVGGPRGEPPPPPPQPRPPAARRAWPAAALALALTSLGGVYLYKKINEDDKENLAQGAGESGKDAGSGAVPATETFEPYPSSGEQFPPSVEYLLVGAGTASFAAMRALRAARPTARVLLVGEERDLPYMRPPLSKEVWRDPELAQRALHADNLTFRQWNGRKRALVYEPPAFYTPVERLADSAAGGAAVARGWRVARLDVQRHEAELVAAGRAPVLVRYGKCLVATGAAPRRHAALRAAAAAGRSLALRSVRDTARLAAALDRPDTRTVAVLGGGFLATELSAALADRLQDSGKEVVQVVAEEAPMAGVLPLYLARDAARRLVGAGVRLVAGADLLGAELDNDGRVALRLSDGTTLTADLVVECLGAEVDPSLADASALETHPTLGGLLVNAELQARSDVYAAGDAACFYDVVLGRRRVEHHDHAVVSGRLAGDNMAAVAPPKHYTHQSMFWSDLGPQLGYEAIGIIDSRLPTVGIFSADAVADAVETAVEPATAPVPVEHPARAPLERAAAAEEGASRAPLERPSTAEERRYERGVVFYLRERRVVGVLLWNLFNRMHVARQVLAHGEFDDLFEVGKLFAPHEED